MVARLLASAVAFICLGVVGCDDPEVQDKALDLMNYGLIQAKIECSVQTSVISPPIDAIPLGSPEPYQPASRNIRYKQVKFADGSCFITGNNWLGNEGVDYSNFYGIVEGKCGFPAIVTDNPLGYGPGYDPETDHTKYSLEGNDLTVEYCDYAISGCVEAPTSPYSSATVECTGFNLSAFE